MMGKLTKKQVHHLELAIDQLERGIGYIQQDDVVMARVVQSASTAKHYIRNDGEKILYEVNKDYGSNITGVYQALRSVKQFIDLNQ